MSKPVQGEELEVEVSNLGINGEGIARSDGFTIFIPGALPGEMVLVKIDEVKPSFAKAQLIQILQTSSHRTTPPCPLFEKCGGCQIMHLKYSQQLVEKEKRVRDALERIGKIQCQVEPCMLSPQRLHYRNKIQLPVNGQGKLGLYAYHSHTIIPIENCHIHSELGEVIFADIQTILNQSEFNLETAVQGDKVMQDFELESLTIGGEHSQKVKALPIVSDYGSKDCVNLSPSTAVFRFKSLRHVLIKTAYHTQEALVVLITEGPQLLTDLAKALIDKNSMIKGVVQNWNMKQTNTVLGKNFKVLAGEGWIEEILCGLVFKISPASFFQVNPTQAENLYQWAIDQASLTGNERVLDAYCGVGTLSLLFASKVKEVIGIEYIEEAVEDAKKNAERNELSNATFIHGKTEEKISQLGRMDLVILNPPRKGCDEIVLRTLIKDKPSKIIYISCDPATLARDLKYLINEGHYQLKKVQPFDMFPQTMHVETVAILTQVQ